MPTPSPLEHTVTHAEADMKLTTFIERRLATPPPLSMLHKWIRSGQVRVNKKRAKPFQRLEEGDSVRIPPFAALRQQTPHPIHGDAHTPPPERSQSKDVSSHGERFKKHPVPNEQPDHTQQAEYAERTRYTRQPGQIEQSGELPKSAQQAQRAQRAQQDQQDQQSWPAYRAQLKNQHLTIQSSSSLLSTLNQLFTVIEHGEDFLVINKPSGLAVQPGTGLDDSVVERLRLLYAQEPFIPAPAHRLDKNTSGLLAIGTTHKGLAALSRWFASHTNGHKHYFAWIQGDWPAHSTTLEDYLCKSTSGLHNMECVDKDHPQALYAKSHVTKLKTIRHKGVAVSLLRIALVTGRTHQIRVQLSSRHAPIIGDVRYGGPAHNPMLLHAYELVFPESAIFTLPAAPNGSNSQDALDTLGVIRCLPAWEPPFSVSAPMAYSQRA